MKQILSVLILTVALFSCKKSTNNNIYTVTGIVLDYDNRTTIAGAKVFAFGGSPLTPFDSAISNGEGRVSFSINKSNTANILLSPQKNGYFIPGIYGIIYTTPTQTNRTDSLFLVRPSMVSVTTHKVNTYLPTDSINIKAEKTYLDGVFYGNSISINKLKANDVDKNFIVNSFFVNPYVTKVIFETEIIRNGAVLFSRKDTANLIQHSTANLTINY